MFKAAEGSAGLSKIRKTLILQELCDFFHGHCQSGLLFHSPVKEKNLAFEKGHLFSWAQGTSGYGSDLLTSEVAHSSYDYQWYISLLFNHGAALKAWTLGSLVSKKQHEHTWYFVKYMNRLRWFLGVQNSWNYLLPWNQQFWLWMSSQWAGWLLQLACDAGKGQLQVSASRRVTEP